MPITIDYDSPRPPYQQIAADLRGQIERGELADGARLPSITQLQQQYGVARTTAIKAMKVLAEAGLAEIVPGWGSYAKAPPPAGEG